MKDPKQLIFGAYPVLEKLKAAPSEVSEIFICAAKQPGQARRSIEAMARAAKIAVTYVTASELDRMAAENVHQGIAARIKAFSYHDFSELLRAAETSEDNQTLILDGVTDPRNFGALLRTAEAVGLKHVVIPRIAPSTSPPRSSKRPRVPRII